MLVHTLLTQTIQSEALVTPLSLSVFPRKGLQRAINHHNIGKRGLSGSMAIFAC